MNTPTDRYQRVVGLCHAIRDFTFVLHREELAKARAEGLVGSAVTFLSGSRFEHIKRQLQAEYARRERVDAGGPVSNTLYAMGTRLPAYPRPFRLEWSGPYTVDITYVRGDPLASLRTVGVSILAAADRPQGLLDSICVVSAETGEAEAVIVGPRPARTRQLPPLGSGDLALVQVADLVAFVEGVSRDSEVHVALLTADCQEMDSATAAALEELAHRARVRFAFGKRDEFLRLGLLTDDGPHVSLRGSEIVATDGADRVEVWASGASPIELDVLGAGEASGGSFVGAGDAYAGAYLCARLLGEGSDVAHEWGCSEARLASYSPSARRTYSANLTELFGPHIDRQSDTPDWGLHQRIRQTAGLTILSCGTTGVDEHALEIAQRWGLAAFAVTKKRQAGIDGDPDQGELGTAHHIELGSSSNRYCTWANVFLADGTVLMDLAGTEGSDATRRACATLNRPILELGEVANTDVERVVRAWIEHNAIRVLHVAGNRVSNIPSSRRDEVRESVERAILAAAMALGGNTLPEPHTVTKSAPVRQRAARIGCPYLDEVRQVVQRYIASIQESENLALEAPVLRGDDVSLYLGRSLDLVRMVDRGIIDFAIVGSDMVCEVKDGNFTVRAILGVFNAVLATVAPSAPQFAPRRLVAQYPNAAERHFARERAEVIPIVGMAETWLSTGEFDGAVDTWRTGRTAEASGLTFVDAIASTSLAVVEGVAAPTAARQFVDGFVEWMQRNAAIGARAHERSCHVDA